MKLESLNISSNHIKSLPQSMSKLTSLREVDASTNQLTSFPVSLCQLKNLDSLNVSHNKITSVPSDVASLNVVELNLNQNRVCLVISCKYICKVGVLTFNHVLEDGFNATINVAIFRC